MALLGGRDKKSDVKLVKGGHVDTLISSKTEVRGDVLFTGVLCVDGKLKGNIRSDEAKALLTVGPEGMIEGEVKVPNVIIHGTVTGDVHASAHVSLSAEAVINGNVYYHLIEMNMGASINGQLVHKPNETQALEHKPDAE
ncbi:bactofilin family protein [Permianibacter aggregans]|uniref:Cytoskeletal protein CcmA (Bactofilin family) n=1 Tax=Permianibacter aggregans TaxID=1510150 RepID=A0A4R6UHX8_9GAMM|nr:polymer-forming cytoskeletal protein [Permianibacter aggregans]QGX39206.1 polymer-forming cytoskeletal protein [Permianibacter aggregans]TDQ46012.1 cytoskeletal protein CcmA (bactofilin family) [Permianibacter aggregans]